MNLNVIFFFACGFPFVFTSFAWNFVVFVFFFMMFFAVSTGWIVILFFVNQGFGHCTNEKSTLQDCIAK